MWVPPERIRHAPLEERAPTAEEAARSLLFSPLRLSSGLDIAERSWVPAMFPGRAGDDGHVTRDTLDWYGRIAEGRPGVLVVEATGICDTPSGALLQIGHDRFVPGLRRLAEVVRARSGGRTRLFVQLLHFLRVSRRPQRGAYFEHLLAVTPAHRERLAGLLGDPGWTDVDEADVRAALARLGDAQLPSVLDEREMEALHRGARERVTDVSSPHIRDLPRQLPELFAAAAVRVREAGADGVELHYAHAYTMASFLSALNTRSDGYGGPREHRVRLPVEVHAAVRARVGRDYTVGCRFLCDEIIEGGSRVEDAAFFGVELARAGMDFLSLSTGGKHEDAAQPHPGQAVDAYTGRSGHECMPTCISDARGPFGRQVAKQAQVRRAVRAAGFGTPVVVAGGICTFTQAEGILQRGEADLVAAARQTLADPDWLTKLRLGRGAEVRRCTYTNYCEGLDHSGRAVTCKLWDREGLDDPAVKTTEGGRRRLVAPPWPDRPRGG